MTKTLSIGSLQLQKATAPTFIPFKLEAAYFTPLLLLLFKTKTVFYNYKNFWWFYNRFKTLQR